MSGREREEREGRERKGEREGGRERERGGIRSTHTYPHTRIYIHTYIPGSTRVLTHTGYACILSREEGISGVLSMILKIREDAPTALIISE